MLSSKTNLKREGEDQRNREDKGNTERKHKAKGNCNKKRGRENRETRQNFKSMIM